MGNKQESKQVLIEDENLVWARTRNKREKEIYLTWRIEIHWEGIKATI